MRIFLIGFMGSGKSYVGKKLARLMQRPFIDLDNRIETNAQRSIREIFAQDGEAAFRQMERQALHETAQLDSAVIACGGGVPCFFDNIAWMNANGVTIYLRVPEEVLFRRLKAGKVHRPLLRDLSDTELRQYIRDKLAERELFYRQASVIYDVQNETEDVAEALARHFSNIIGH